PTEGARDRRPGRAPARPAEPGVRIGRLSNPDAVTVRALWPGAPDVESDVRAIIEQVTAGGDAALAELAERFDPAGVAPDRLAVPAQEIEGALGWADPSILQSLRVAIANVRAVAEAQVGGGDVV